MDVTNPYQEVIDWLHTPAGERWSERRLVAGELAAYGVLSHRRGPTRTGTNLYGSDEVLFWGGILSVKEGLCAFPTS